MFKVSTPLRIFSGKRKPLHTNVSLLTYENGILYCKPGILQVGYMKCTENCYISLRLKQTKQFSCYVTGHK